MIVAWIRLKCLRDWKTVHTNRLYIRLKLIPPDKPKPEVNLVPE